MANDETLIETLRNELDEAFDLWVDAADTDCAFGRLPETCGLELLNLTEDQAAELFDAPTVNRLAAPIRADLEVVQLCCVTFDCPGDFTTAGTVTIDQPVDTTMEVLGEDGVEGSLADLLIPAPEV